MPLRTPLQNGDQVEIITSKAQTPSPTWERFVVTGKARACIRRFIRSKEREQYLQLGRSLMQRGFREEGYEYYDKALEGVLKNFKQATVEDLLSQVGAGYITARTVVESAVASIRVLLFLGTAAAGSPTGPGPLELITTLEARAAARLAWLRVHQQAGRTRNTDPSGEPRVESREQRADTFLNA